MKKMNLFILSAGMILSLSACSAPTADSIYEKMESFVDEADSVSMHMTAEMSSTSGSSQSDSSAEVAIDMTGMQNDDLSAREMHLSQTNTVSSQSAVIEKWIQKNTVYTDTAGYQDSADLDEDTWDSLSNLFIPSKDSVESLTYTKQDGNYVLSAVLNEDGYKDVTDYTDDYLSSIGADSYNFSITDYTLTVNKKYQPVSLSFTFKLESADMTADSVISASEQFTAEYSRWNEDTIAFPDLTAWAESDSLPDTISMSEFTMKDTYVLKQEYYQGQYVSAESMGLDGKIVFDQSALTYSLTINDSDPVTGSYTLAEDSFALDISGTSYDAFPTAKGFLLDIGSGNYYIFE